MLKKISKENFKEELASLSDKVVLVDFYASWCEPCKMLSAVLEKISKSRTNLDILKIDVDEAIEIAKEYEVEVVPTIILFKNSSPIKKIEGYYDEEGLLAIIEKYMD